MRKCATVVLLFLLVVVNLHVSPANAASFSDLDGHWAEESVNQLADLGIYSQKSGYFYPDKPISRGEALALLNRVLKKSYGQISDPDRGVQIDYRYPLAGEIRSLVGTIDKLFYVGEKQYNQFKPGHNMLYYLNLAATNKTMRNLDAYHSNWWLSSQHFQAPMSREEASMILFHVLSPQIREKMNISPSEVADRFDQYYSWKVLNQYIDTASPYATVIRDYRLFDANAREFHPNLKMTRGQYAVVLKRLYDYFSAEKTDHFQGNVENRLEIANLFLTAATYSYQKQNENEMKRYFEENALRTLNEIKPAPLHQLNGELRLNKNDLGKQEFKIVGSYYMNVTGKYLIEYRLKRDDTGKNPYGWMVASISYTKK